jgi:nitrogen-specific signal transduction histidine kinase
MGLGLAATQNIIHTHKGRIDIDSEEGKGTKFNIEFDFV